MGNEKVLPINRLAMFQFVLSRTSGCLFSVFLCGWISLAIPEIRCVLKCACVWVCGCMCVSKFVCVCVCGINQCMYDGTLFSLVFMSWQ